MIWVAVGIGVYVLILLLLVWKSVAPFRIPIFLSPGQLGLPQEKVSFTTGDGIELKGWWMPKEGAETVAVFLHGYMMNRSELVALAAMMWQRGVACLLLDLRAHGESGGKKTGFGWLEREDARAAVQFVRSQLPLAKVLLVGSSMGSAAAAFAVSEEPALADALILDSAYSRLDWAAMGWWRFLGGPLLMVVCAPTLVFSRIVLGFPLKKADVAESLRLGGKPALLLHGDRDQLALPKEAIRNAAAIPEQGSLVWFERCNHSGGRYFRCEEFNAAVFDWLEAQGLVGPIPMDTRSESLSQQG